MHHLFSTMYCIACYQSLALSCSLGDKSKPACSTSKWPWVTHTDIVLQQGSKDSTLYHRVDLIRLPFHAFLRSQIQYEFEEEIESKLSSMLASALPVVVLKTHCSQKSNLNNCQLHELATILQSFSRSRKRTMQSQTISKDCNQFYILRRLPILSSTIRSSLFPVLLTKVTAINSITFEKLVFWSLRAVVAIALSYFACRWYFPGKTSTC